MEEAQRGPQQGVRGEEARRGLQQEGAAARRRPQQGVTAEAERRGLQQEVAAARSGLQQVGTAEAARSGPQQGVDGPVDVRQGAAVRVVPAEAGGVGVLGNTVEGPEEGQVQGEVDGGQAGEGEEYMFTCGLNDCRVGFNDLLLLQHHQLEDHRDDQLDQPRGGRIIYEGTIEPIPQLTARAKSKNPANNPAGFLDRKISEKEVSEILQSLAANKACGHDDLPNECLKEAPSSFVHMLTVLYNRAKEQGKVPKAWSRGRVVLVHKRGPRSVVGNYRPLTVLTCMSGTFSKLLNKRLTEVVERHGLLGEIQNGFRKDRSGIDSAFIINTIFWKTMQKRKKINVAFLDLQKVPLSYHALIALTPPMLCPLDVLYALPCPGCPVCSALPDCPVCSALP